MSSLTTRRPRRRTSLLVGALAAVLVAAVGCSTTGGKPETTGGGGAGGGTVDTPRMTVAMITHEVPGDAFWDIIRKGAEAAAAKDNIDLRYSADPEAPNQANLVQAAIDSKVDGIAVTLAKPDAMRAAVKAAQDAGIPVVAFNGGFDQYTSMGIPEYFGQDERNSGIAAGERLTAEGAKKIVCVIHEQGSVIHEARCGGVAQGFKGQTEIVNVNSRDMPAVEATITAKLQQDPTIDHVMGLSAAIALTAVKSVANAKSQAKIVNFDTSAALVDAIQKGEIAWAVDQQPYLQGYLAVDSLWLLHNNRIIIGGGKPVLTGPAFVDQSNAAEMVELAKRGTR
jgi:simple sugar transport system substrate-binding protein